MKFYMKSILVIVIIVVILMAAAAMAENNLLKQKNIELSVGRSNVYAWTDNYLYAALAYSHIIEREEEFDLYYLPHRYILRIDRKSGEQRVLIDDFYGECPYIICQDEDLIIIFQKENYEKDYPRRYIGSYKGLIAKGDPLHTVYILKLNSDVEIVDTWKFYEEGMLSDAFLWNGKLILQTGKTVRAIDLDSGIDTILYNGERLYNHSVGRVCIEGNAMYLNDGGNIYAIDLESGNKRIILRNLNSIYVARIEKNKYIIMNDIMYFWSDNLRKTVALDLKGQQGKTLRIVSNDRFFFLQCSEEGVMAAKIPEEELEKLYANEVECSAGYLSFTFKDYNYNVLKAHPSVGQLLFYPYPDTAAPSFDPDNTVPIPLKRDWDLVLLDNYQYIEDVVLYSPEVGVELNIYDIPRS